MAGPASRLIATLTTALIATVVTAFVTAFVTALAAAPPAPPPPADPPAAGGAAPPPGSSVLLGWTRLELRASKLIARADAAIERWPAAGGATGLMRVRTEMRYLGQSKVTITYSERLEEDGLPVRWMELEPSRKAREWRAGEDGRLSKRRFGPPPGQKPPWTGPWTEGWSESIPFEVLPGRAACGGPLDPWTFLARLDCLVAGPESTFQMFTNDGLITVRALRAGTRRLTLDLRDDAGNKPVETVIDAVRIQLRPAPGQPDPSVFGMSGGLELLVEPASGALVSIEGRREGIPGVIRFTLAGLSRAAAPRPAIPWPSASLEASRVP